jgi:hypothetical protein
MNKKMNNVEELNTYFDDELSNYISNLNAIVKKYKDNVISLTKKDIFINKCKYISEISNYIIQNNLFIILYTPLMKKLYNERILLKMNKLYKSYKDKINYNNNKHLSRVYNEAYKNMELIINYYN